MKNLAAVLRRNGTEGRSPQGGVPQSRFFIQRQNTFLRAIFSRSSLIQQPGHITDTLGITIFPDCKNTYSTLLGSPNLIFLQIRFIIILQKMRSRKLKKLLKRKLLLNVKSNEVGLSKIDFFKFLCYNIYRKMRKIKILSQISRSS